MIIKETKLQGIFEIIHNCYPDNRGEFVKTFRKDIFAENKLETDFPEEYFNISKKNVLRGLHFQTPPFAYKKIVTCLTGKIFDIIVDLRINSPTYGKYEYFLLDSYDHKSIYISEGFAHGFQVLSNEAYVSYKVSSFYNKEHDSGIMWNSLDIDWPVKNPVISARDQNFICFNDFKSPFKMEKT